MYTVGRVEVITGGMFSGKTEELLSRLERVAIAGVPYLLFKPTVDTRCGMEEVATHKGWKAQAHCLRPGSETVMGLIAAIGDGSEAEGTFSKAGVIAFDEGNFFSQLIVSLCEELALMSKRVIVAGLDMTFTGEPFGSMPLLMAIAHRVDKLHAVCARCGDPEVEATYSLRLLGDGSSAPSTGPVIEIGGKGKYEAVCGLCRVKAYGLSLKN